MDKVTNKLPPENREVCVAKAQQIANIRGIPPYGVKTFDGLVTYWQSYLKFPKTNG